MVSYRLIAFGASFVSLAAASADPNAVAHAKALLAKRQSDDNEFTCHSDCGFTIVDAGTNDGYCSNNTWITQLNECLSCAADTDDNPTIWENYGDGVNGVLQACQTTATPGATIAAAAATGSMTTMTGTATSTGAATAPTSVEDCHNHDDGRYCFADDTEWEVTSDIDDATAPDSYSDCRPEGDDTLQCVDASGAQVTLQREDDSAEDEDHDHDHASTTAPASTDATTTGAAQSQATGASASSEAKAPVITGLSGAAIGLAGLAVLAL